MRDLLLKTTNKGSLVCDMLSFSDNPTARLALKRFYGAEAACNLAVLRFRSILGNYGFQKLIARMGIEKNNDASDLVFV